MDFEIEAFLPSEQEVMKRYGLSDNGRVQKVIDTTFIHYMRLNMPIDNGIMAANTKNPEGGLVTVETPYAHYQNEGILYVTPEHNAPGFPVYNNGVLTDYKGYRGKRVPSERKLKNYYVKTGGTGRGAHFVERTSANYFNEILKAGQKEIDNS